MPTHRAQAFRQPQKTPAKRQALNLWKILAARTSHLLTEITAMCALDLLQEHAEIATVRLAPYVIAFDQQSRNYRIVKFCRTGETHMGSFKEREDAEDWLLTRLPKPAATRVDG